MNSNMYTMVTAIAATVRDNARDAVLEEAALLALDLLMHTNNGGDSLLDELNAQFDVDERLEQADGREELAAAVEQLQLAQGAWLHEELRKSVLAQLVMGMHKRMFALADEYARIVGCKVESGWASDYATEETRRALYVCGSDDEPLMGALERRWAPLELVEQHADGMTVYDWRWDETWRYTGNEWGYTIEELNASLYVNGNEWGYTIDMLIEEYGVTCWQQVE